MKKGNRRFILMIIGAVALTIVIMYILNVTSGGETGWNSGWGNIWSGGWGNNCLSPSGDVTRETRSVDSFNGVTFGGYGNLYVTQDGTNSLEVEAQENVLEIIETSVENGILNIGFKQCITTFIFPSPVNIYVSMDDITKLELAGSGNIVGQTDIISENLELILAGSGNVDMNIDADSVSSTLAGSGTFDLSGTATEYSVVLSGSGNINAYNLITEKSTVIISGSGNAHVYASEELKTRVSGSGKVKYEGDPGITLLE